MNWDIHAEVKSSDVLSSPSFPPVIIQISRSLRAARTYSFNRYGAGASTFDPNTFVADPDGAGPAPPIQLSNPNFNFKSIRGNVVLRWEYFAGSTPLSRLDTKQKRSGKHR